MARRRLLVALLVTLALTGVWAPAARASGPGAWRTLANGDEILALALQPGAPDLLWAGTEGGGLVRWNLDAGTFQQLLFPLADGLAGNEVRDIAFDAAGAAWLAVPGGGVTHAQAAGMRRFTDTDGLPVGLDLTAIAVDGTGTVWVGTRADGLAWLSPGATAWAVLAAPDDGCRDCLGGNQIADLAVSPDGQRLYIAHGRSGLGAHPALSVLDVATGSFSQVQAASPGGVDAAGADPASDQLMALAFDGAGTLWAATWAKGVLSFDGRTWRQHGPDAGLCGRNVWAIAAGDRQVWAACGEDRSGVVERGAGVARWDGAAWRAFTTVDGLPSDDVVALAVAGDRAFLGTNVAEGPPAGIVPVVGERVEAPLVTATATIPTNDLTALAFSPDGTAWVGTRGLGLLRYDGRRWQRFTRADTPGLAGDMVTALAVGDGVLYVGTAKSVVADGAYVDGGLSIHDLATGGWRAVRAADGALPDDEVAGLAAGPDGRLWLGLGAAQGAPGSGANAQRGEGLAVWDPRSDAWGFYTRASTVGGLPGDTVTALAVVGAEVWAAASYASDGSGDRQGGGVGRLAAGAWTGWPDGAAGFATFADPGGEVTGDVRAVLVDRGGTAWAGTWDLADANELSGRWPRVNAVVNGWAGDGWHHEVFPEAGWVSALAQDTVGPGRLWAGVTRGHGMEFSPAGAAWLDSGPGGAWVRENDAWQPVSPATSGLAARSVTAMAVEPTTGHLWLATENSGLSILEDGAPLPAAAAGPTPPPAADMAPATAPRGLSAQAWVAAVLGLVVVASLALVVLRRLRRAGAGRGAA